MRLLVLLALPLALAFASPRAAQAQRPACEVRSPSLAVSQVMVSPPGAPSFELTVEGAEVTASLRGRRRAHAIHVRGPLEFDGTTTALTYSLKHSVSTSSRMVRLSATARLDRVWAAGDDARVDALLGFGVEVLRARVPCDALSLDGPPAVESVEDDVTGDGTFWVPRRRLLTLRRGPGVGSSVSVRASIPLLLSMRRLARRGEHYRLRWSTPDGSSIEGWVHRDTVRPMSHEGISGSTGGHGEPGCAPGGTRHEPGLYQGPARVQLGASVHVAPGRGEWAHFVGEQSVVVEHSEGAAWVRLAAVPGVFDRRSCGSLQHAWVRRELVTLPEDADQRRSRAP